MPKLSGGANIANTKPPTAESEERIRKSMDMNAAKLEEARRILGARTDTDAVDQALDYVIFQSEVFGALDTLAALGGLRDLDEPPEPARRIAERRRSR